MIVIRQLVNAKRDMSQNVHATTDATTHNYVIHAPVFYFIF